MLLSASEQRSDERDGRRVTLPFFGHQARKLDREKTTALSISSSTGRLFRGEGVDSDELDGGKHTVPQRVRGKSPLVRFLKAAKAAIELPLYFVDVITDIGTVVVLLHDGNREWAGVMLCIILMSWCSGFAVALAYAHYRFRFSMAGVVVAFILGLPAGMLLALYLDLSMVLFAGFREQLVRRAERLGTDSLLTEFATFIASYTVVRQAVEVTTESFPQCILQLYIYLHITRQAGHNSVNALIFSVCVSFANLLFTWLPILYSIRYSYASQASAYFLCELSGGARIPLSELERDESEVVSMSFGPRGPSDGEVLILREVIGRNSAAQLFVVHGAAHSTALPLRELLFDEHISVAEPHLVALEHSVLIARVLAHNPIARTLQLDDDPRAAQLHATDEAEEKELKARGVWRGSTRRSSARRESSKSAGETEGEASGVFDLLAFFTAPHLELTSDRWTEAHLLIASGLLLERAGKLPDGTATFDGMRLPMRAMRTERLVEVSSDLGGGRRLGTLHASLLVGLLTRSERVHTLSLDGEALDVRALAVARKVDLRSRHLRGPHAIVLAQAFALNKALSRLVLWGCHIGDSAMPQLLRVLHGKDSLAHLDLSWNPLGPDSMAAVAALLDGNTKLESLVMHGVGVRASGAKMLRGALENNSELRALVLFSNEIGDAGATSLAKGLAKNTTLAEIGLAHNNIGDEGGKALAAAVKANADELEQRAKGSASSKQAERLLGLATGYAAGYAARLGVSRLLSYGSILSISLGGNRLGDESAVAFADVLATDPSLNELHLAGNLISEKGCAALAVALVSNTNLHKLDLRCVAS